MDRALFSVVALGDARASYAYRHAHICRGSSLIAASLADEMLSCNTAFRCSVVLLHGDRMFSVKYCDLRLAGRYTLSRCPGEV